MARCKGCIHENVCNREVGYGYSVCPHYINSADVVPKGEVERLEHILNSYALQYGTATDQQDVIDKIKTEVARQIFEEIEAEITAALKNNYARRNECNAETDLSHTANISGKIACLRGLADFVDELKKKYKGGKVDGTN